ncbi:hypothetical protein DXX93_06895 [Thalassotalea euphylliae]|uniref:Uncharacterized protein n=1 Tax=Thalassotalea euphylliae TaxID=1655234 RepID=A0A3E0TPS8_9GAMM|nr:hypothetical protein [Thalassotalea euphylliae]REL26330.1 hypothetical protein DXX93_06895 [Thalassotalea euphylliae]
MANLGKLMNFVFSGVSEGVKIAWDKKQANKKYREIISTVKLVISNQGRSLEHADAVLNVLVNLVPMGQGVVTLKSSILIALKAGESCRKIQK